MAAQDASEDHSINTRPITSERGDERGKKGTIMKNLLGPLHISKSGQYIRKSQGIDWPAWNVAEMNMNNESHAVYARLFAYAPELLDMLETMCNGLAWNIENHPTVLNQSDDEMIA